MHSTTMEPQHQAHNGPAAISGVWQLNLVWKSPQKKRRQEVERVAEYEIVLNQHVFVSIFCQ